jgi:hypothetical protein
MEKPSKISKNISEKSLSESQDSKPIPTLLELEKIIMKIDGFGVLI